MRAYLDSSSTTKPCAEAVSAAIECMEGGFYNPSSAYAAAIPVNKRMDSCRNAILGALGVSCGSVVFTSGGTESDNIAISGAMKKRGAEKAVTTAVEHPAVLNCVKSYPHTIVPVDEKGGIDLGAFEEIIKNSPGIGVVSAMDVNNETGVRFPIEKMAEITKKHSSALFHCDGVQGFLHAEKPAKNVDLYSISAHKIHGLKGSGALYIAENARLEPINSGGGQENGLRNGTENTAGIYALEAAVRAGVSDETSAERMMSLKLRLFSGIMDIYPNALVNGADPKEAAAHILNISFPGILAEVLLHALEGDGVLVSTGSACAARRNHPSHVLSAMGLGAERIKSAVRFSLCRYTTEDEIGYAIDCLKKHLPVLSKFRRR